MRDQLVVCCESQRKSELYMDALLLMGVDSERIRLVTPEQDEGELSTLGASAAGIVL